MVLNYTMEEAIRAWRLSSRVASFIAGRLSVKKDYLNVAITAEQRNVGREDMVKIQQHFTAQMSNLDTVSSTPTSDISNEALKTFAISEELVAVIKESPDVKNPDKPSRQILEIWKNGILFNSWDLSQFEKHGRVYTDGTFGCLEFSPDNKHLVYISEKKKAKASSFLKVGITASSDDVKWGTEYDYLEEWGEQLTGKSQPVVCLFKVNWEPWAGGCPIQVLEQTDDWSPGQMTWLSNEVLVGVAWFHHPRRLGLIYCTNRPSKLFKLNITCGEYEWFGSDDKTACSPRVHRGSNTIIYLQSQVYGPHHKEHQLVVIDDHGLRIITTKPSSEYCGIYSSGLPKRCWTKDDQKILFSTPFKGSLQSYVLDFGTSQISKLPVPVGCTGGIIMDVVENIVLLNGLSLIKPDQLFLGKLDFNSDELVQWIALPTQNCLPTDHVLATEFLKFDTEDGMEYAAMLTYDKSLESAPLIVCPHGGPHSTYGDQFKKEVYLFNQLGYAVLMVDYRGSIGYGEKALNSLLGKVGDQDVKEVHHATCYVLEKYPFLNRNEVFLFGGSHGGFLVTHLSGQYPEFYRAVSARNPVTDIASMFPITDITDWPIVESLSGQGNELEHLLTNEVLNKMRDCSPIKHVKQVKASTLLLVGKNDLRVPPSQSVEYYHALKLNGVKTKMIIYEDCHPLSKLPVDVDALINTLLWFQENRPR